MRKAKKHGFHPAFEMLEGRCLLSSLPFDDSGLAPAGLAATCALPNLPVYNVKSYGATGNGVTDDTVSIRNALAAAEAAGGGIIYLPAGTYDVCPQASDLTNSEYYTNPSYGGNLPIFVITTSNIVFIGDGEGSTHIEGYSLGMKDPVTNWYSASSGGAVVRFDMFLVDTSAAISTIQFRSLDVCGNAGWTGDTGGTNPTTGDGWDETNKCIAMWGDDINDVLIFNCALHDFRGEIVYQGGTNSGSIAIVNCDIYSSNGDGISCGSNLLVADTTLGGDTPGSDLCNGIENFCMSDPEQLVVENCSISSSSSPADLHGNGIVYLAPTECALSVTGCTISDCQFGIELAYFGRNITIQNNAFSDNQDGIITVTAGWAPTYVQWPMGWSNVTISSNSFNDSGAAFLSQSYDTGSQAYVMSNLAILNNTVTNGSLLQGAYNGPTPGSWTGFVVNGNVLGVDTSDAPSISGNNFALWTNTIRTDPSTSGMFIYDYSGTSGPIEIIPGSDLVDLAGNGTTGNIYVDVNPAVLAAYPVGFTVTFISSAGMTNWVIQADPTWNTLTSDLPVTASGVTLQVNAQGLFALAPTLSGIETTSLTYNEGQMAVPVTVSLAISDLDSPTLAGATVQISGNYQSGEDVLSFTNTANITGTWNAATGTLTLTGTDTLADYQAALQSVTYEDTSDNPNTATRTVSFQVDDGQAESNEVSRQIAVSSAPVLAGIESGPLSYTGGEPATAVTAAITASDADSPTLAGATVWISGNYRNGEDVLSFTNTATITGTWDATTGTLTLTGTDTLADYQAALQSVTYVNTSSNPSSATRIVSFQVTDGVAESNVVARQIAVTPASQSPLLAGIESGLLTYTEGEAATPLTAALTVADGESVSLAGATVWISGNYQSGEDVLSFTNTANIMGSWNAATGTLTLTGIDSLADYQAALQSVAYADTSSTPSSATRTISFQVNDCLTDSNVATRQVAVDTAVSLGPATLPADTVHMAYNQTLTASGGTGATTLAVTNIQHAISGLIVPISGNNSLSITGMPMAAGTETFTVTATDTLGARISTNYSITVNAPVTIGPATLPADTANVAYNQTLTASGGTGTKTLAVTNIQNAIAGLVLPASGSNSLSITGKPTAAGTETFTVTATDARGARTSTNYSITVNAAVVLGPATLPADTANVAYNQTLTASGGTGAKTLAVTNIQNAIAGLVVPVSGSNSLSITGTPTAAGTETFTVTATDTLGARTSTNYSITVNVNAASSAIGQEILGNGQPGFWSTSLSTWTTTSNGLGGSSLVSSTPNGSEKSQAAWWFSMPAGVYEISITYTAGTNLTKDMGLDLYDGVGNWIGEIPVDEQVAPSSFTEDGVAWENLGAFRITSNVFHISTWNSATDGAICINGIQLQAAPVIDDTDTPISYTDFPPAGSIGNFTTSGSWSINTQGAFGGSLTSNTPSGSGSSVATWTMPVTPGSYEVDVTWPASAVFSASATYNVYNGSTKVGSVTVDQQTAPSGVSFDGQNWKSLGSFTVTGTQLSVTLANTAKVGLVDANAIRILPAYQPTPIVNEGYPGFWSNSAWTTKSTGLDGASLVSSSANGSEESQAAWWFPILPGKYEVYATWVPGSNLSPTTPFDVYNSLAYISESKVNEQDSPVGVTDQGVVWQSLGIFTMTGGALHVSTWNSQANGAMSASAIRIVPVSA